MAIVLSLCAAYVAYCLGTNPAGPITTPDSIRYIDAWANYPLGYHVFLQMSGLRGAIVAQPILFGASLAFLGSEIVKRTRSTWLAVAVVGGSMLLPQIREFHASILTESLFLSLLILFLAGAVRFAYQPAWQLMVPLAVAAGISVTVRRTGFAFLPLMLIMVAMQRASLRPRHVRFALVACLAPFLAIYGIEQAAAQIVHAGHPSSLTGRHLFAKAALMDAPPAPASADPLRTALDRQLESDFAPIRDLLAAAPRDLRAVLSLYYETCLQGGCADRSRELMPGTNEADQTRILGDAGMARILRAPMGFLALMAMNYESLWTVDRLHYPGRAEALTAFIASHRPMPYEDLAFFRMEPGQALEFQPSPRVRYMQLAVTVLAIWTGGIAVVGLITALTSRMSPVFAVATTAALAAHGGLLLTALLAAGFARFTMGLWPTIVMAAAFGFHCAVMFARPFRSTNF